MMAYEGPKEPRTIFSKSIYQFKPKTKGLSQETRNDFDKTMLTKCLHYSIKHALIYGHKVSEFELQ